MAERIEIDAVRTLADQAREWFAVLATAVLSGFAAALALILWLGRWSPATEAQRVGFLGVALILVIALVGFGSSWLWRMQIKTFEVKAGLVQVSAQTGDMPVQG